jgi:ParB-like chromosome segregation protein Spo0J
MEDDILSLLDPTGALRQRASGQATSQGLTSLGLGLLRASRGQPGQGRPSIAQAIGEVGPVALQAYQQSFDKTLADTLRGMQVQEMQKRRQQQEAGRTALQQAYERMYGLTPQGALAMPGGQVGPTVQRAEMIGQRQPMSQQELLGLAMNPNIDPEAAKRIVDMVQLTTPKEKETFRAITEAERKSLNLPADIAYQVSSTGKISQVGQGPLVKNIVGGEQSEFGKQADKEQAQIFSEIKKSGQKAIGTLRDVTRLGSILERSPGGWEAGIKLAAGNFGIKSEGLTDLQTAEAIINRLVPQQRPPGTGQMSDADLDLFKKSLPRIINQPGGNKAIISYLKGINEYLIKEGEIASLVLNRKITPIEADQRLMALQNPLEEFKNSAAGGLPPGVTVTPIGR